MKNAETEKKTNNVLIVDEMSITRLEKAAAVEALGCTAVTVSSSEKALTVLKKREIDLVIVKYEAAKMQVYGYLNKNLFSESARRLILGALGEEVRGRGFTMLKEV